jgi:hypothetical protein
VLYERYCPAKTNKSQKWYKSKGLVFTLNGWYFVCKFKRNLIFKSPKNIFSGLNQKCGVSISMEHLLLQITDSGKQANQLIAEIGLLLFC